MFLKFGALAAVLIQGAPLTLAGPLCAGADPSAPAPTPTCCQWRTSEPIGDACCDTASPLATPCAPAAKPRGEPCSCLICGCPRCTDGAPFVTPRSATPAWPVGAKAAAPANHDGSPAHAIESAFQRPESAYPSQRTWLATRCVWLK